MDKPFRAAKSCVFKWSGIVLLGSMTTLSVSCKKQSRIAGAMAPPIVTWTQNQTQPTTQPVEEPHDGEAYP